MNQTYVALLRGINVGGNAKVEMKKLKHIFERLGYSNISTYINSGNVIFDTDQSRDSIVSHIESALHKELGLSIRIVIRNKKQVEEIAESVPKNWTNDASQRTDVLFLWDEVNSPKVLTEILINPSVDILMYKDGAVIWHLDRAHYSKSKMHKLIGTRVYKQMTGRNINTVRKLRDLMNK